MSYRDNMSAGALSAWDRLTAQYGDLRVNSAYRDPEHNRRVGGAKQSQHMHGNAFDVDVSGMPQDARLALINDARAAGFLGIGVYDNALHFDVGPERAWGADYTRNSLPEWAASAFGAPAPTGGAPQGNVMADTGAPQGQNALAQMQQQRTMQERLQQNSRIDPRAFMASAGRAQKLSFT